MREFVRNPLPPAALVEGCDSLTREWLRRVGTAAPGSPAQWTWGPQRDGKTVRDHILPELKRQTDQHCSYCDAWPVTAVSKDTVDHFRPKGKGWWPEQAYLWSNLFYACDACQSEKAERFDERVLKPDVEGYRWQDYFRFNPITGCLLPRRGIPIADRLRARATIRLFGLNRRGRPQARRRAYRGWLREGKPPVRWRAYRFCLMPVEPAGEEKLARRPEQ